MADLETPAQQAYQISTESMRLLEDALKELCKTANTVLGNLRLQQALFEEVYHSSGTLRDAIERCLKRCAEGKEPEHG